LSVQVNTQQRPKSGQGLWSHRGLRQLKAFVTLAALPAAAMTLLGIELTSIISEDIAAKKASRPAVSKPVEVEPASDKSDGTNIPPVKPKRSTSHSAALPDTLTLRAQTASLVVGNPEDPVGDYVASFGVQPKSIDYTIVPGDTLLGVLAKLKVSNSDAAGVMVALKSEDLGDEMRIMPGRRMTVDLGGAMRQSDTRPLVSASIQLSPEERAIIKRGIGGTYQAAIEQEQLTGRTYLARGVITSSLAGAAANQGVSGTLVAKFASIYAYDVDFQRDIHPNDTFEIYYTEYANDEGEVALDRSEVLFTRLSFAGKVKTYYRYVSADGKSTDFYDQNGKSARTFLMRTPVDGARISSSFGMRHHPILGYTRMHKGIDFAAPTGTRIYAAGAGVIERAGRNGGYGNFVEIKHANGYETEYGHLSRYAKGIKRGMRVAQGQVIGYVGSTGISTGPHLHYGVLVHGKFVNPMSVRVPTGIKLAGAELDRFRTQVSRIDTALKVNPANQIAEADNGSTSDSRAR